MAEVGRPTKFTDEHRAAVLTAIGAGNTRRTSAAYAGISERLLMEWLARGRAQKSGAFTQFLQAVEKAEADAIATSVAIIRRAATETWTAAAWWLERRYPDEWGRKDRVAIEHILDEEGGRMAEQLGLDKGQVVADAERILQSLG